MNRWVFAGVLAALAAGLLLRSAQLGNRPMHNDEAVNGVKFAALWGGTGYRYDPNEHHGPSLYYATMALARLTGAPEIGVFGEGRLRAITVLFGLACILVLPLLVDALGRRGTVWAALFMAVSPSMVFYSRYYIHEMLLVFGTLVAVAAGWRYWRGRRLGWALVAGAGLGLMHGTKETFVLTLAAGAGALLINHFWNRKLDASGAPIKAAPLNPWHLAAGLAVWLVVAAVLFTSFFSNAHGLVDSIRTYLPWLQRAGGDSPHIHPWHFYLHRLLWFSPGEGPVFTEILIFLLAAVAAFSGFARRRLGRASASFVRFLALYTVLLTAIYSVIGYKTPWCLLNFWLGAVLLAGVGAAVLLRGLKPRAIRFAVGALIAFGGLHLSWQAWVASTQYAADRRNPHVYAHTSKDLLRLVDRVEALAAAWPQGHGMMLKTVAPDSDYWPLPWYLRRFPNAGWWDQLPSDPFAPVMIVSARLQAALDEKKTHLMVGYFELRPAVFLELYVQKEVWEAFLRANSPVRD